MNRVSVLSAVTMIAPSLRRMGFEIGSPYPVLAGPFCGQRVCRSVTAEEDRIVERAAGQHRQQLVPVPHPQLVQRRDSTEPTHPTLGGDDDVRVFANDVGLRVEFSKFLQRSPRLSVAWFRRYRPLFQLLANFTPEEFFAGEDATNAFRLRFLLLQFLAGYDRFRDSKCGTSASSSTASVCSLSSGNAFISFSAASALPSLARMIFKALSRPSKIIAKPLRM